MALSIVTGLAELRARVGAWKRDGLRVGFVPTMGNLHAGHASLVALARRHADRVVASVFVNPTQFGPHEDFSRYPRTPEADAERLREAGCDLLWLPSVDTMYPLGVAHTVRMHVPGVTATLEGEHRPGHFDGVATVVSRLFNQVQPDVAAFGRKDYQQLAAIRHLVRDLSWPVALVAGETLREADGLAMSSRNQYLSAEERPRAARLYQVLQDMALRCRDGQAREAIETAAARTLADAGFDVDYVVVRMPDLTVPADDRPGPRVALVAGRLGRTRLIDNLEFERP